MASPGDLVSAFAIHSKRRKSAESVSPIKPKRTRSSHSETEKIEIFKTPTKKLPHTLQVSLEDIRKTPTKMENGGDKMALNNWLEKKKKTPKKSEKSTNEVEDNEPLNGLSSPEEAQPKNLQKIKKKSKKQVKVAAKDKKINKNPKVLTLKRDLIRTPDDNEDEITNTINPIEEASTLVSWLIHPLTINQFFKDNWEKAPLHIKRGKDNYFKLLISTPQIDELLRNYIILFTKNIDITAYVNDQRETHNPDGRALPSVVWDYYANGCSVRMLNPQTFFPKLHNLNATLQEFFGCFVGSNFYLTPPGSQGFAPHYDDIEAFILQIEGKKRWRLYKPRNSSEFLPRVSSKNFEQSEIGEPILDVLLEAGDVLYFPRGTIHQGETLNDSHSLHITLSVYQKNSWGDFLEKLLPDALETAINEDSQFREGLPLNYLNEIGFVHSDKNSETRRKFIEKTKKLLHAMIDKIDVDKAVDLMAKKHMHDYLPAMLAPVEKECSALEDGERMTANGIVESRVEIEPDTRIRLARGHAIRLMKEDNTWKIYYSADNSKEYHEFEVQYLEVEEQHVPAIKEIIVKYPGFVKVDDLPIEGEENRVQIARDLWEKCIVVTDVPLPIID